ncbi:hypothetical protein [Achromobacter xylosoxidans]|uniref:hypothetical protein n=1 Tax=Alcaligenes xylosoxydans xylosoxydans TaxID=85698 RepID=UPI000B492454|nr:hypothetical protein [Achromobacter xylosoxidans]
MSDTKHGWVTPRADGARARCGGPGLCPTCNTEAMHEKMLTGLFGAPAVVGAAAAPEKAPLTGAAARLSAMANEARKQYQTELAAGGEPTWPAWVDDLAVVLRPAPAAGDALRRTEMYRLERDHERAKNERLIAILVGIHGLTLPAPIQVDGKTYVFTPPEAVEILRGLSDRIRAIPDEIAAALAAQVPQQGEA